ncbi:MAG TPA: DUF5989 family protein [Thermoanaerobaculia bacterium]|jgi:hypothetical protein
MFELIADFWDFVISRKKLLLVPVFLVLLLLGILLIVSQTSALAPFIYSLF